MYPYFIFYSLIVFFYLLSLSNSFNKKIIEVLASITVIIFAAIRYDIGWDYNVYERILNIYKYTGILVYERDEKLSNLLYIFSIKTNIYLFFIITSIITYGLITKTLSNFSKNFMISLIFFVIFPLFYLNSFSVIRNFLAVSIVFYGVKYILNKNLLKYILIVIVASMFHKSALVALLGIIPLLVNITPIYSLGIFILIIISKPFISFALNYLDVGVYHLYLDSNNVTNGQTAFIMLVLIYISIVLMSLKIRNNKQFNTYFFMTTIGMSIFILFWGMGEPSHRLSLYFTIYILLLLPFLIRTKPFYLLYILGATLIYIYMIITYSTIGTNDYVPYKTLLHLRRY